MKTNIRTPSIPAILFALVVGIGASACSKQGPLERAGEEIDEGVDTLKNGGKESTANKLDDAGDELREGARKAADEVKDK